MSRRRRAPLILFFALAAVAASLAAARTAPAITIPLIDLCAIAPANTTLNLPPGGQLSADSGDGSYASSMCGRYVVDVNVPAGSAGFQIGGRASDSVLAIPSFCNALTEYETVYQRDPLTNSFTRVAAATFKGIWSVSAQGDKYCYLSQTAGDPYPYFFSAAYGSPNFRVAISAKVATIYGQIAVPVSVFAGFY